MIPSNKTQQLWIPLYSNRFMDPISGTTLNTDRRQRSPTIPKVLKWSFSVGALQIITWKMGVKHHGNPLKTCIPFQNYELKGHSSQSTSFQFLMNLQNNFDYTCQIWTTFTLKFTQNLKSKSHALLVMISLITKSGWTLRCRFQSPLGILMGNDGNHWSYIDQVRVKSINPANTRKKQTSFGFPSLFTTCKMSTHITCLDQNEPKNHPYKVLQNFEGNSPRAQFQNPFPA